MECWEISCSEYFLPVVPYRFLSPPELAQTDNHDQLVFYSSGINFSSILSGKQQADILYSCIDRLIECEELSVRLSDEDSEYVSVYWDSSGDELE